LTLKLRGKNSTLERLHKLLFELSSNERINIMLELQKSGLKLSQISRKMDLTVTEASRHLQRLNEAMLIQKDNEGYFQLTPFGKLSMSLLPALGFASKHREYFLEYDISKIPIEFVERIGELEKSAYVSEIFRNLEEGENRIREASELVWILSDQVLASSIPTLAEKMKNTPFDLRIVLPEGMFPPEEKSRLPSNISYIQKRVLPRVDISIVCTEKYAVFCLSNRNGKIDYTGFAGTDKKFHKWCKDLFLHYWEKAKPIV
jgi:predicted transcriptional regulator